MNTYSLDYIDDLYVKYVNDPNSVSDSWRRYFEQFLVASDGAVLRASQEAAGGANGSPPSGSPASGTAAKGPAATAVTDEALWLARVQDRIDQLVREYRVRGHLNAQLDPLGLPRPTSAELNPSSYGLSEEDLSRPFDSSSLENVTGRTLSDILEKLRNTYCRSIGAQFMHIDNRNIRDWLQRRMELTENRLPLAHQVQRRIYTRLADASIFEEFVRRKFVGAKTFSLEGAESLIPMIDLALEKAGQHKVQEVVMGMAHRGRLNVLANIFKKRALNIFWSFEDPRPELSRGGGDVRYHLGYSSDWTTATGDKLHISLCFNPSHLEFVNPVALGRCRSKQDRRRDSKRQEGLTILIHGDAAFAGEGVAQETLNLSQLAGYHTGGTLHIVINNQVGFTTEPFQGRSTTYATDVARMLQIPIFHVNGEDPEAVAQVVSLAMDFRREFRRDVVIDLYAYRRWGHNEGDEPRFTQPLIYQAIDSRKSVRESYLQRLLELGEMTQEEADEIHRLRQEKLETEFEASHTQEFVPDLQTLGGCWQQYYGGPEPVGVETQTGVPAETLSPLLEKLTQVPVGFKLHKKLKRPIQQRREMAAGNLPLDWASAEAAAFASLLSEGHRIRLTGQDSERGTFSQRHAVWHDSSDGQTYMPLANLSPDQAPVEIINSPLSEVGVLGFEYGYSLDCPEGLVAWEAQFGDFWNVAQVIVDQFIASGEDKWKRLSGLVMLLPHGFEGQGPEHCSARLERFLAMAAEHNIQVCQPTTPAQYFHLLRRQVLQRWRKPLIALTPKSLLRHPHCVSDLSELTGGSFRKILPDPNVLPEDARRVLLCTGKIYYDLLEARQQREIEDVAIMRIEQLYPLSSSQLLKSLEGVPTGSDLIWVQEEPANMGAWPYMKLNFGDELSERFQFRRVSRNPSASPSTGSLNAHKLEQAELLDAAFAGLLSPSTSEA
ncbi:2-oxoglutarate dehydrogenase E1 component [Candidatus Laterigemmans baculatus]|uniref:2-oxoglutarate dehydrogenase E1 component n=1 Tax=Candidatus Laterigemmans baculatus TaxID=2770505 RepID=UPI0013DA022E|nr:2-oxoglutarate dehydrogenase E1 component [Candidatus Laterigemmans baculatus]